MMLNESMKSNSCSKSLVKLWEADRSITTASVGDSPCPCSILMKNPMKSPGSGLIISWYPAVVAGQPGCFPQILQHVWPRDHHRLLEYRIIDPMIPYMFLSSIFLKNILGNVTNVTKNIVFLTHPHIDARIYLRAFTQWTLMVLPLGCGDPRGSNVQRPSCDRFACLHEASVLPASCQISGWPVGSHGRWRKNVRNKRKLIMW